MIEKIKQILKENFITIILFLFLILIFTFELPYYIETPGGIINTESRIKISQKYKSSGSFNLAYVGQLRATLPLLVYAKINDQWSILKKEEIVLENETIEDVEFRERLMLEEANNIAVKLAYDKAQKNYQILNTNLYVTYVDEIAKTNLKVQDQIIGIDNQKVKTKQDLYEIIESKKIGEELNLSVINNKKKYIRYAKVIKYKNKKMIGIIISEKQEIKTNPEIKIQFKNSESGASGGLMMTLSIYNNLITEDLTKGKKIVGTGTIDENGNIGEIDGVIYKLIGAVKEKADIFFVPDGQNYKDAIKLKKQKKYKIKIIKVKTFDDAVNYLTKKE